MTVIVENVVKTFVTDTLICSKDHTCSLKEYMMKKHNWSYEVWNSYFQIYVNHLDRVGLLPEENSSKPVESTGWDAKFGR